MKKSMIAAAVMASMFAWSAQPALAAPCKDAKGKFVKCVKPAPAAVKKGPCKDAKGRFIKCK